MNARRALVAALTALTLVGPVRPAYAHDGPDDGGAFNPVLTDSPVTVVICTTPAACPITPGGAPMTTPPPCVCGHLAVVHVPHGSQHTGRCTGPCDCPAYTARPEEAGRG